MASIRWGFVVLLVGGLMVVASEAQSNDEADLRKEVEQLKAQLKTVQGDLDRIKATLREQSARTNPVFDVSGDPAMGDASAKLVVIEFSDFECPYCLEYYKTIYHQVLESYVKTGKVRYVFGDFPGEKVHPHALKAAEAGRCANEQGKFWEMHDQLFARQRDLGTTGMSDGAKAAGLNVGDFETCLAGGRYTAAVREAALVTANLGLQGTPAFVFGTPDPLNASKVKLVKALVGAQPYAQFQQVIDSLLAK
jgi:protein-disulfide isomerase